MVGRAFKRGARIVVIAFLLGLGLYFYEMLVAAGQVRSMHSDGVFEQRLAGITFLTIQHRGATSTLRPSLGALLAVIALPLAVGGLTLLLSILIDRRPAAQPPSRAHRPARD